MNSQKSLIIGMGKTGHSFAQYLCAKGISFDFADTRKNPPNINDFRSVYVEAEFYLGDLDGSLLPKYQQILLSPGVDIRHPFIQRAKQQNISIKSDIDIFVSEVDAKIVGITGSNGKTTLTDMMGHTLHALNFRLATGGNIGTAALTLLNNNIQDIYILELSSFQLDISSGLALDIAVILNITEDHMDRYDSFADYQNSKLSIYDNAKIKVINIDEPFCNQVLKNNTGKLITFSLFNPKADIYFSEKDCHFYMDGEAIINANQFLLQGMHNYQNIAAALAIAKGLDIDIKSFAKAATAYKGLPHRCELVAIANNVTWINDSKATNIGATCAAVAGIKKPMHLIMGGQAKDMSFTEFAQAIPEHIKSIILLGEDAQYIQSFIQDKVSTILVEDMRAAIQHAMMVSISGDTVLLSPACASFDMYDGYEARGNDFKSIVMECVA